MKRLLLLLPIAAHAACPVTATLTKPAGASLTLSWGSVTTYTDATPIASVVTYNLYNLTQSATAPIATGLASTTSLRTGLSSGLKCYAVTAVADGVESAQSAPVAVQVTSPPSAPTGVTAQ